MVSTRRGQSVFAALEAGARGNLTKDATAAEIQRAIRTVFAGEALLDASVLRAPARTNAWRRLGFVAHAGA